MDFINWCGRGGGAMRLVHKVCVCVCVCVYGTLPTDRAAFRSASLFSVSTHFVCYS